MKKKEAYYFPHFINARNDNRVLKLRRILGLEGYAIFFMLLEILREQTDMKYPLAAISELEFDLRTKKKKINSVIYDFELFTIDETSFYSSNLIQYMQPWMEKSERARAAAKKKWEAFADAKAYPKADAIKEEEEREVNKVNEVEEESTSSTTPTEIKNEFLLDIGLRNTWISKGFLKEDYEHGVDAFINQRLRKDYKKGDSCRSHFINWMPNYFKSIQQVKNNQTAAASSYADGQEKAKKYDL